MRGMTSQGQLFAASPALSATAPSGQLLKWIGNKQRMAEEIVSYFPQAFGAYHEPFLGSAAVLGTLAPASGFGSDAFAPLMEIWTTLQRDPELLARWYEERWQLMASGDKVSRYEEIKASYNARPNGADLLFLCRACYGGVVRFRKDGYMSTPCGAHRPIPPAAFLKRTVEWRRRVARSRFDLMGYEEALARAKARDVVYCDPPYTHTQAILYGAQSFSLPSLLRAIDACKRRGVFVALSIDGTKRSGNMICDLPLPDGLFEREILVSCGRSMLRRFQMGGRNLDGEVVADRLLLTWSAS